MITIQGVASDLLVSLLTSFASTISPQCIPMDSLAIYFVLMNVIPSILMVSSLPSAII